MLSKFICVGCNTEHTRRKWSTAVYCSNKCQQDTQYRLYIDRWKAGLETGVSGAKGTSLHIRRYILEKYNSRCCQCDWCERHPQDGRVPVELDHIDGDHSNNKEENLRLLCPNCHSLTPTYKSRNIGRSTRKYKNTTKQTGKGTSEAT